MPIVYNKKVRVGNSYYCDTYLSSSIPLNIRRALASGAEKVLVLDGSTKNLLCELGLNMWVYMQSSFFKKRYKEQIQKYSDVILDNVFCIKPMTKVVLTSSPIPRHTFL